MKKNIDQNTVIESCKVSPQVDAQLKAFAASRGLTVYELLQYFCFVCCSIDNYSRGIGEVSDDVLSFAETFRIGRDMRDTLISLRSIMERSPKEKSGTLRKMILIRDHGVVEVYDPTDGNEFGGSITLSIDKALKAILSSGDKLPDIFRSVMKARNTDNLHYTIAQLFEEEAKMIGQLDDSILGYAQNVYGQVPKKTHTIKPKDT